MLHITQQTALSPEELAALHALILSDPYSVRLPWDIIKTQNVAGHLLCYENNALIAYLGFFLFEKNAAHVFFSAQEGTEWESIFSILFSRAQQTMLTNGVKFSRIIFRNTHLTFSQQLQLMGAVFSHKNYHLQRTNLSYEAILPHPLFFREALPADASSIATIDAICFNEPSNKFNEAATIFLAYLGKECIGKCHLYLSKSEAWIYDFAIIPLYQGKGFGKILLQYSINFLLTKQIGVILLEVNAQNNKAFRLYQQCHFFIESIYEYWTINNNPVAVAIE